MPSQKDADGQQEFAGIAPPQPKPLEVSFTPKPSRRDPAIWVRKLSVWSAWPPAPETELRTITLRRGLNILWAESKDDSQQSRIGGHGAGKSTFCRFVRFILDEKHPGTSEFRQEFRRIYDDGWVLAEVIIENELWLVGKTLGDRGRHHFAIRGADTQHPFDEQPPSGGYEDYQKALETAALGRLEIRSLSGSGRALKWVHLLAWLARDQEAHYSNLLAWRDTASEPEGQDLSAADRENLVRLVMGLLTEQTEQDRLSDRAAAAVEHETKVKDRMRLNFFRERARNALGKGLGKSLDDILGGKDAHVPDDPLLLQEVETQAAALDEESAKLLREAGLADDLRKAEERLVQAAAKTRFERVVLAGIQKRLGEWEVPSRDTPAQPRREPSNVQMNADVVRMEKMIGEIRGLCNQKKADAIQKKCPFYLEPGADETTERAITKQESRDDAEEAVRQREVQRLRALLKQQESAVTKVETAEEEERDFLKKTKEFIESESTRLGASARRAKQLRDDLASYQTTCKESTELEGEVTDWQKKKDDLDTEIAKLAEAHQEVVGEFALLFEALAKELLGEKVESTVKLGKGLVPTLQYGGRRRKSAALNLSTLLAFDLASLALGMTSERSHHPRFVIHDSPRESDLAIGIYHALFRAGRMLEKACEGEPAFQYIVTTTEAPPPEMNGDPWRLEPVLDASVHERRFLGLDLG